MLLSMTMCQVVRGAQISLASLLAPSGDYNCVLKPLQVFHDAFYLAGEGQEAALTNAVELTILALHLVMPSSRDTCHLPAKLWQLSRKGGNCGNSTMASCLATLLAIVCSYANWQFS